VILYLTLKTAVLVGETPAEWQLLEKQARAGQGTTGTRSDEGQVRALAAERGVTLREEGVVPWKRRWCKRKLPGAQRPNRAASTDPKRHRAPNPCSLTPRKAPAKLSARSR
jgi:hypothetical protein